jgi:malonyl-CoA O-methyltransferase
LLERLDLIKLKPQAVIDLGAGTGYFTRLLAKRYRKARIYAVDNAIGMLRFARQQTSWLSRERFVAADMARLPFLDQTIDLAFSNLALHWCGDFAAIFQEVYRILKPGGFFIFSVMGPDTLKELRDSWLKADDYPHVNTFMDMHLIGDLLLQTNWSDPVMDMEYLTLRYGNLSGLIDDLRKLGANNLLRGRRKTLTGKNRFKEMALVYEERRYEGLLPATYEIVYGHAWRLSVSDKEVGIPVSRIREP